MHGEVLTATSPRTPDMSAPDSRSPRHVNENPGSTDLRGAVLAALRERPGSISVYALLDLINRRTGKPRHANSLYRILNQLIEADLALHVVSLKHYMARPQTCGSAPLLLLCKSCHRIDVVSDPNVERGIIALATRERFGVRATHLEMPGTCALCAARG